MITNIYIYTTKENYSWELDQPKKSLRALSMNLSMLRDGNEGRQDYQWRLSWSWTYSIHGSTSWEDGASNMRQYRCSDRVCFINLISCLNLMKSLKISCVLKISKSTHSWQQIPTTWVAIDKLHDVKIIVIQCLLLPSLLLHT